LAGEDLPETVFVYGTLRRGCINDAYLIHCQCTGMGWTRHHYALYLDGCPAVVKSEAVSRIRGEVYQVSSDVLAKLDLLEGHPDEYYRLLVPIDLDTGGSCLAWLYFYPCRIGRLLASGDYLDADRLGAHIP
jgi:gamma-glutamylaminecyclotransferase